MARNDNTESGCLGIFAIIALVLIAFILILVALGLCWAGLGFLYLVAILLFCGLFGVHDYSKDNNISDIDVNTSFIGGLYSLVPTVVLGMNLFGDNLIPKIHADWAFDFYAPNWYVLCSGFWLALSHSLIGLEIKWIKKLNREQDIHSDTMVETTVLSGIQFIISCILLATTFDTHCWHAITTKWDINFAMHFVSYFSVPALISLYLFYLLSVKKIFAQMEIWYLYSKADGLFKNGHYLQAILCYEKVYGLEEIENPYAHYAIGCSYFMMGNYSSAKDSLKKAISLNNEPQFHYSLAQVYLADGDKRKFNECFENIFELVPRGSKSYQEYQSSYSKLELKMEYDKNYNEFERNCNLRLEYKKSRELGKSVKCFETAIELKEKLLAVQDTNFRKIAFNPSKELKSVQVLLNNEIDKIDKLYIRATELYGAMEYDSACKLVESGLAIAYRCDLPSTKLNQFKSEILEGAEDKKAKEFYDRALDLYKNSRPIDYDGVINNLNKSLEKKVIPEYSNFLYKVLTEKNGKLAQEFYEKALAEYEKKHYQTAYDSIKKSTELIPNNPVYAELKRKIQTDKRIYENEQKARKLYESGLTYLADGEFDMAQKELEQAVKLCPDNEVYSYNLEKAQLGKIDIAICTKKGIMTLDGFDDDIAEVFLSLRDEGRKWYDLIDFLSDFGLAHKMPDLENRVTLYLKPNIQYGRGVDF